MIQRRQLFGIAALPWLGMAASAALAQSRKLVISGAGGTVAEVSKSAYYEPFTAATGIAIEHVPTEQQRMAQLEAMVRAGRTTWDAMEISASDYPLGVQKGLFEKIDYTKVDPKNLLPAVARMPYGVGAAAYSEVLVVRRDKLPAGKSIKSWADFWDVKTFPGPRALSARPQSNLEYALLADGVPAGGLYAALATRQGQDRAFRKLDQIKSSVTRFWKSGAESVQLLSSGEVAFGSCFNGRVNAMEAAGVPVEIVWNGGALHLSYIGIPKGARNVAEALEFVRFRTGDPVPMRKYIAKLPYPGFAAGLADGLPETVARALPTHPANLAVQFSADEGFWAKHLDELQERWNEWMLK
ncbi:MULTISPECIES: ABC transporter substrate-binding protein [unclassified Hydrogenophaga]|uniref:ABC transporter substrate-binding protein n=1 Tax=unclassified Hydrogenophaga TaxID=2610897 RepID=UPI000A9B0DA3|nr:MULTISPECIES: ABC transporter substrate-binding protein [unclassified Hydrogenophaga]MBN9371139.1 ABC transporter substrate-binding protein [Hydrogenophaga sp.]